MLAGMGAEMLAGMGAERVFDPEATRAMGLALVGACWALGPAGKSSDVKARLSLGRLLIAARHRNSTVIHHAHHASRRHTRSAPAFACLAHAILAHAIAAHAIAAEIASPTRSPLRRTLPRTQSRDNSAPASSVGISSERRNDGRAAP